MERLLLREDEVCERLSLGRSTVRRLMAEGSLVSVHVGRALRFPVSEVERFARELAEEAQAQAQR